MGDRYHNRNQPATPATPPPPDTTNALALEFQKLIVDLAKGAHNQSSNSNSTPNATASSTNALPPSSTQQLFNLSALPPGIQLQYDKHATSQLIKGKDMGPFMTNVPDDLATQSNPNATLLLSRPPGIGHRLLTRDSTVFYLRDQGAKTNQMSVSRAPICKGNTPEHIRAHGIWLSPPLWRPKAIMYIRTFASAAII